MNVPHTPFPRVVPHVIPPADMPAEQHQREVDVFHGWLLGAKTGGQP